MHYFHYELPTTETRFGGMQSNISFIEKDEFSPADYFNGIEFRLVSWRFAYEILNENHAWLFGVSPGDAQDMLNAKYPKNEHVYRWFAG